ncbi:MAG: alpha/beta hydrolase [Candidatus Thiodiazotropha sp. DIVDIV]
MNETLTLLEMDGERIFTVEHHPHESKPTKAYIFIHPFAEEKLWSHRVYVATARAFCDQGVFVARFDFRGHGDSDGEFSDSSLDGHLKDVNAVIDHVKSICPSVTSIGLLGLRLGGSIAVLTANSRDDVDELILWDPVLSGDRYMQDILRSNLAAQMAVKGKVETTREDLIQQMKSGQPINIEGYYLKYPYFQELSSIDLLSLEYPQNLRCCLLQIVRNPKQPLNKQYQNYIEKFTDDSVIDKAHEEQFWKEIKTFYNKAENLEDRSTEWLK